MGCSVKGKLTIAVKYSFIAIGVTSSDELIAEVRMPVIAELEMAVSFNCDDRLQRRHERTP
jgi:hypothetical protein